MAQCTICNGTEFTEGPAGRKGKDGKLPRCASCGSLERHRAIRAVWNSLVGSLLQDLEALQFSSDPAVEKRWFRSLEISIYGKKNSLDMEQIDRKSNSYDLVICNHVLEHVENDRQAIREIMRILKPAGFFQFTVPTRPSLAVTDEWGYPDQPHGHYRVYGTDIVCRFGEAMPSLKTLAVLSLDEVTGQQPFVYFASMDAKRIEELYFIIIKVFPSATIT